MHIKDEPSNVLLAHTSILAVLHVANRIEEKTKVDELVLVLVQSDNSLAPCIEVDSVTSTCIEIILRDVVIVAIIAVVNDIVQAIIAKVPKKEEPVCKNRDSEITSSTKLTAEEIVEIVIS